MIVHVKIATFLAKYSCKKYNNSTKLGKIICRATRRHLCRCVLWALAITDAKLGMRFPHKNYPTQTAGGIINTYPPLFDCMFLQAQTCYDGIVDRPYNGAHFIGDYFLRIHQRNCR